MQVGRILNLPLWARQDSNLEPQPYQSAQNTCKNFVFPLSAKQYYHFVQALQTVLSDCVISRRLKMTKHQ